MLSRVTDKSRLPVFSSIIITGPLKDIAEGPCRFGRVETVRREAYGCGHSTEGRPADLAFLSVDGRVCTLRVCAHVCVRYACVNTCVYATCVDARVRTCVCSYVCV